MEMVRASTHLSSEELAAYLDRPVSAPARPGVEAHLATCALCAEELVAVARLRREEAPRRRSLWYVGVPAVAAAAAIALVVWRPAQRPGNPGQVPVERAASAGTGGLAIVVPAEGGVIAAGPVTFVWRGTGDDLPLYHLVVTTEAGDSVWEGTTRDTSVTVPAGAMVVGGSFIWFVDVLQRDGRPVSSGVHQFRVSR